MAPPRGSCDQSIPSLFRNELPQHHDPSRFDSNFHHKVTFDSLSGPSSSSNADSSFFFFLKIYHLRSQTRTSNPGYRPTPPDIQSNSAGRPEFSDRCWHTDPTRLAFCVLCFVLHFYRPLRLCLRPANLVFTSALCTYDRAHEIRTSFHPVLSDKCLHLLLDHSRSHPRQPTTARRSVF
jgi:hypothetical protein